MKQNKNVIKSYLCKFLYVWLLMGLLCVMTSCGDSDQLVTQDKTDTIAKVTKTPVPSETAGVTPSATDSAGDNDDADTTDENPEETKQQKEKEVNELIESVSESKYDLKAALEATALKEVFLPYFTVGVAINGNKVENSSIQSPELSAIMKYHFNSCTFSNLMKPVYLLDQKACQKSLADGKDKANVEVHFESIEDGMQFAKENHIGMRGHTLIWHNQVPTWFFTKNYTDGGELVNRKIMLKRMENYIRQVLEYVQTEYPGVIYAWDVVNEGVETREGYCENESGYSIRTAYDSESKKTSNLWYQVIGADYIEQAFAFARKYAEPQVRLFYNDYNTFEPAKNVYIVKLLKDLQARGLVDGIGIQSYLGVSSPAISGGNGSVREELSRYAELGLEIQVTELTIPAKTESEEGFKQQAERYYEMFRLLMEMDEDNGGVANITNVTFFGLMDHYLFYPDNTENSRLFDKDLQPKAALFRILDAVDTN